MTDPHTLFGYGDRVTIDGWPARVTDVNEGRITVELLDEGLGNA